jgi:phosphatidylserine decarboxylase
MLLSALPKVLLSRTTGMLTDVPLPRALRPAVYRAFARRYGVTLGEVGGELADFRSLSEFFRRPLRDGARPIDEGAALVWPCDGRIATSGPIREGRIPQIKDIDYALTDLLVDGALAARLTAGSQATIYLAPGDYHRVHAPFAGQILRRWHVSGGLFPVNPPTRAAVPDLFVRNERVVLECRLECGRTGAVVMVAALNVGDIRIRPPVPRKIALGEEIGVFGFGSTVIAIVEKGDTGYPEIAPDTTVRMGRPAAGARPG